MKNAFIIPIIIGVVFGIVGIVLLIDEAPSEIKLDYGTEELPVPSVELSEEIEQKLEDIEKKKNENEYYPKDREWLKSGSFEIDRSEYVLGEKIFLRISNLDDDAKGQIVFLRPLNTTHYSVYFTIPFDGSDKAAFNYYLEPQLSKLKGYCSVDDFIGDWRVVFRGTDFDNLEFKITEQILPGEEEKYMPVC